MVPYARSRPARGGRQRFRGPWRIRPRRSREHWKRGKAARRLLTSGRRLWSDGGGARSLPLVADPWPRARIRGPQRSSSAPTAAGCLPDPSWRKGGVSVRARANTWDPSWCLVVEPDSYSGARRAATARCASPVAGRSLPCALGARRVACGSTWPQSPLGSARPDRRPCDRNTFLPPHVRHQLFFPGQAKRALSHVWGQRGAAPEMLSRRGRVRRRGVATRPRTKLQIGICRVPPRGLHARTPGVRAWTPRGGARNCGPPCAPFGSARPPRRAILHIHGTRHLALSLGVPKRAPEPCTCLGNVQKDPSQ